MSKSQIWSNINGFDKSIFLGVCKYLVAEALTDANFHSYREPVSKVIKGKLSTVIVEVDGLGSMKIPVGKKSIINLLDEVGPFMASAAGWSGTAPRAWVWWSARCGSRRRPVVSGGLIGGEERCGRHHGCL